MLDSTEGSHPRVRRKLTSEGPYNVKKVSGFSRPQPGRHLPNSSWAGINKFFQARENLVSDIPAGEGEYR